MKEPRWLRRLALGVAVGVAVGQSVLTSWLSRRDMRVDQRLRHDGVTVDGEVVERHNRLRSGELFYGNEATVRFTTVEGRVVRTRVTGGESPKVGPALVRYLPPDPSIAGLVSDPAPVGTARSSSSELPPAGWGWACS